ncbi:MAG: hypothetical protein JWM46_518 [Candidatus Kaiserbacteria bacterium]|nr:hypothetical protein [Candidatus Kaiserbacteria bacterium]
MLDFPNRRMEDMLTDRVHYLLLRPQQEIGAGKGLARALHVAAFTERAFVAYFGNDKHDGSPGFFTAAMRNNIADRLRNAHLQPEESRFRDILDWKHCNKPQLHDELRINLLRLLKENPQPYGVIGLELHLLLDMRMMYNATGYRSAFEESDHIAYPQLRAMRLALEAQTSKAAS